MAARLPAVAALLLRRAVPSQRCDEIVRDLADEYAIARQRGPWAARWWLARETASIAAAYLIARLSAASRLATMLVRDVRLVLRGLRHAPLAAIGGAAMLATGLAAVLLTAGLSQALLRHVSSSHGDALARVGTIDRNGRTSWRMSYPELDVLREHVGETARIATVNMQPAVIRTGHSSVQTMVEAVDGQYLALVGAAPSFGRSLLQADDLPSAAPAVVLSDVFWRRHFDASPAVLGRTVHLNGSPFTVVGVLKAIGSSSFLGASVDAWVPVAHADPLLNRGWRSNADDRWFTTFALPAGGAAALEARLASAARDLGRRHPESWRERRLQASPATVLAGSQRGMASTLAAILATLALLILATSAANLSGVFLARAASSRRQAAIHMAIGSGRAAIVRRHIIEGGAIGLGGAALALAAYQWIRVQLAEIALLPTLTLRLELPLTIPLVIVAGCAAVLAGVALAAGPAFWAARVEVSSAMRGDGVRATDDAGIAGMRRLLVSAQVAFAVVLTAGALRFTQSLDALRTADLGFARERLAAMDFDVEPVAAPADTFSALARAALARAAAVPGVLSAAMSNRAPVDQSTPSADVRADRADGRAIGDATFYLATTAYFQTVGLPLIAGRAFTDDEAQQAADVAVVNATLAAMAWPDEDPIGRGLYLERERKTLRVVGMTRDSRYRSLSDASRPHFYRPTPPRLGLTLLVRTLSDPHETLGAVQRALDGVGPGLVGFFPRTLDDHLAIELLPARAAMSAASALGALALLFSGVGLFGLVSWFVALRRREIGIRVALGARPSDVRRLVVWQAATAAAPGLVVGLFAAVGLGVLTPAVLFGVSPIAPGAYGVAVAVLVTIVWAASYVPARRATRVDAATILRG